MGMLNQMSSEGLYSSDPPYYTYGAPQGSLQPATPPQGNQLAPQQQPTQQFADGGQSHGARLAAIRALAPRKPMPKQSRASAEHEADMELEDNTQGYGNLEDADMRDAVGEVNSRLEPRNRVRLGDRFVEGPGTGRSDDINAMLSDGEYVFDAETVALLGDGSSKAGAQQLDRLRERIRAHKGKALAKGKFSPDAKRADKYLGGK